MSVETQRPPTPPEVPSEANGGEKSSQPDTEAASTFGRVVAAHNERKAKPFVLLGIPEWGDDLVAKFVILPEPERDKAAKKLGRAEDTLDFHVAVLSGSCEEIYFRNPDTDELERIEEGDDPITFETRLTAKLAAEGGDPKAAECKSVREVLLYLVGDNQIALNAFGSKVLDWMTDTSQGVEGELVGESLA